jgi:ribosomal protein S18 acetylase RimI-like enzyme
LLAARDVVVLVAVDGDVVVGYAVVRRIDRAPHTYAQPRVAAYVDQLAVAAAARRSGHGRALMAAAEDHAHAWGASEVTLDVQTFNDSAIAFYRALGYDVMTHKLAKRLG